MGTAVLDINGEVLTASGWEKICTEFHRKNPITASRCLESDTVLAGQLAAGKKFNIYKCKNGLIDVAVPIIIEKMHVGNLFTGQFFFEPPDLNFFNQQAEEFGFDKDSYLDALSKVQVLSMEKVEQAMNFLTELTVIIGRAGFDKKKICELNEHLEQRVQDRTAELIDSNERFRSLYEAAFDGMIITESGKILEINNIFCKMMGYKSSELIDKELLSIVSPKERENVQRKILSDSEEPYESFCLRKDGSSFPVEVQAKMFLYKGKRVRGTALRDITIRKQAEDLLKEREQLYRSLFECNSSVMLLVDPETSAIFDANQSACSYYGYSKKTLTALKMADINVLSEKEINEEMEQARSEKKNYFSFRHRLSDGAIRDVEVFSGPITVGGKSLLCSIVHDISERKIVEEQINLEKNFSESLINSLPGIMYLFDERGDFKRWNGNFESVTGFSSDEILGMNPLDFIGSGDKEKVGDGVRAIFEKGRKSIEATIFTKNGQVIPYYLTGSMLVDGGVKYLVGVGFDITERKRVEKEKENLIERLHEALSKVKQLSGFLPICASCKKIRDDQGYWNQIETYIKKHAEVEFSHGICPDCAKKLYPGIVDKNGKITHVKK